MSMPRGFTVNGIGRLGISMENPRGPVPAVPVQENSLEFTGLAFAIHAGLSILEKAQGRQALQKVGQSVIEGWAKEDRMVFGGDPNQMPRYVDEFLRAIRSDFPNVLIADVGGLDVIAETRRIPGWDGNLFHYVPKMATGIFFNKTRVTQMATAAAQANNSSSNGKKMAARYKSFLFMLAVATTHELTHCFVGYLAQGQQGFESYTPLQTTHLNYVGLRRRGHPVSGESGRWLENYLFGGSIEFYRDTADDAGQAGIPHILNENGKALRIKSDCIIQLVTKIDEEFRTFPFATSGKLLSNEDRRAKGLLSLGSTDAAGVQESGTFMRAFREVPRVLHNISANMLSDAVIRPAMSVETLGTVLNTLGHGATVLAPSRGKKKKKKKKKNKRRGKKPQPTTDQEEPRNDDTSATTS
ncbi:uncharacterized protein FIESC28_04753 [Fusarium coffeatum]|uniref:Uncharacterized protein n=1 Tax=Fusarium coffeatum TaxID=231269 RepID=A0A366RXF4_9HYPO|nr:uncharacterized protein FIESC28_04753 [Fusarium coffeatum]RBR21763.1 hypothetical protein FIESC28_04753 [Fusarium coffeatum]